MELRKRRVELLTREAAEGFRVLILNGPRQSGKSTLMQALHAELGGTSLSLDDREPLRSARTDPAGFVADRSHPLFIDEVQRAGDPLILALKSYVDRVPRAGSFFLAGSSRFLTVPTLTESLAGRARIVDVWPFTQGEVESQPDRLLDLAFGTTEVLRDLQVPVLTRLDTFRRVAMGGFPAVFDLSERVRRTWHSDYVRTLLERDLRQLRTPRQVVDLPRLVSLLAQRTAQEFVVSSLAQATGLSDDTVKDYLGLLETIYLYTRLPAWTPGLTGRVSHRPKLHMVDSGVAASLLGTTADELSVPESHLAGPLLETFAANELVRQATWSDHGPRLYHFRDHAKREVDIIAELPDGRVSAFEIKAARDIDQQDVRHLAYLRDLLGDRFVNGIVLHLGQRPQSLGDRLTSLPISALWAA
jgi:uncharacterized protein